MVITEDTKGVMMSISADNFIQHIESGYFDNKELTELEVEIAGTWIMRNIVATKRSPQLLSDWNNSAKTVKNPEYLTLLYTCCLSLQYYYDSNAPKQTSNKHVILFCLALLKYLRTHDPNIDPTRNYWAKMGQLYHVLNLHSAELAVLNEGIKIMRAIQGWIPGKMSDVESALTKYSCIESLLAQKAISLYGQNMAAECRETIELLFKSLSVRGLNDITSGLYPDGIRPIYEKLKGF